MRICFALGLLCWLAIFGIWQHATACENHLYVKGGIGKNMMLFTDQEWTDQGEAGTSVGIGYRHQISGNWYGDLSYQHFSQLNVGQPLHDYEFETTTDHLYYNVEYRLY